MDKFILGMWDISWGSLGQRCQKGTGNIRRRGTEIALLHGNGRHSAEGLQSGLLGFSICGDWRHVCPVFLDFPSLTIGAWIGRRSARFSLLLSWIIPSSY